MLLVISRIFGPFPFQIECCNSLSLSTTELYVFSAVYGSAES